MGMVLLKIVATILIAYCEAKRLLPKEPFWFRPHRLRTDLMFVVRRLQELGRKAGVSLLCVSSVYRKFALLSTTHFFGRCSPASEFHRR